MTFQLAIEILVIINFTVIGLSHLFCGETWVEFFEWLHSKGRVGSFLNGFPSLAIGSMIVAFHSGAGGWSIALTVIGWMMIAKALVCFVFPDWQKCQGENEGSNLQARIRVVARAGDLNSG